MDDAQFDRGDTVEVCVCVHLKSTATSGTTWGRGRRPAEKKLPWQRKSLACARKDLILALPLIGEHDLLLEESADGVPGSPDPASCCRLVCPGQIGEEMMPGAGRQPVRLEEDV